MHTSQYLICARVHCGKFFLEDIRLLVFFGVWDSRAEDSRRLEGDVEARPTPRRLLRVMIFRVKLGIIRAKWIYLEECEMDVRVR